MRTLFCIASLALLVSTAPAADEPVFSGPQPKEKVTAFKVLGFQGPHAGKEAELIKDNKGEPTMLVFIHETTRPGFQLMRPIDLYASKLSKDGLSTHFIWLHADKTEAEKFLNQAKNSLKLKSPMAISLDGIEGPGNYGLNRKMTITILLAKDNKVTDNFAIIQPNETDAPKIIEAMAKLMEDKKPPTIEDLRKELGGGRPDPSGRDEADRPHAADDPEGQRRSQGQGGHRGDAEMGGRRRQEENNPDGLLQTDRQGRVRQRPRQESVEETGGRMISVFFFSAYSGFQNKRRVRREYAEN